MLNYIMPYWPVYPVFRLCAGVSAWPGSDLELRALEVTLVLKTTLTHWHYPAQRELQFGEWLRNDIAAGVLEPAQADPDIAILLTKMRLHHVLIRGNATQMLPAIPPQDLAQAFKVTLAQWQTPSDWQGDECNIILALARILYTLSTNGIAAKADAADWLLHQTRLHPQRQILTAAKQTYLTGTVFDASDQATIQALILNLKAQCLAFLA